ncbi:MAG: helix-hairpin-helix domain-containing protein [Patescibacteria group bacterium]
MKSELEKIPGVGKSIAQDFAELGFSRIAELKNQNPEDLYCRFCALKNQKIDRCLLYVFRSAVTFARKPHAKNWWEFKD